MKKLAFLLTLLALGGLAALTGWRLFQSDLEAEIYRARLEALAGDYGHLRDRYNEAVRRTAVTELQVADGRLTVAIRDATGAERLIETPFDPRREIYVDFAILDGRLWIRRVFDADTPPNEGLVIDPGLAEVDWSSDPEGFGKAAYRSLDEGRWVVSVSGDGSLGLAWSDGEHAAELSPPPPIRSFEPIEESVDERLDAIQPGEVVRSIYARLTTR